MLSADFLVAGVSALALTVAIVYLLREKLGWRGGRLVGAAFVLAQVFAIGGLVAAHYPAFADIWQAIVAGLVVWLSAMGAWSGTKAVLGK